MHEETEEEKARKKAAKAQAAMAGMASPRRPGDTLAKVKATSAFHGFRLSGIDWVNPSTLKDNPRNPFKRLSDSRLADLVESIRAHGVLVPLIVMETTDGLVLLAGHNRRDAAIRAGMSEVPVQLVEGDPLSEEAQVRIMREEQNIRRGGLDREDAIEGILKHFGNDSRLFTPKRGPGASGPSLVEEIVAKVGLSPKMTERYLAVLREAKAEGKDPADLAKPKKSAPAEPPKPKQKKREFRLEAEPADLRLVLTFEDKSAFAKWKARLSGKPLPKGTK